MVVRGASATANSKADLRNEKTARQHRAVFVFVNKVVKSGH
jgi:hypothetical protein